MKRATLGIVIAVISVFSIVAIILATKPKSSEQSQAPQQSISLEEISKHSSPDDCWTAISGNVYDLTSYVKNHPGGSEILRACGKDATELFTTRRDAGERIGSGTPHSSSAQQMLQSFQIGTLAN